MNREAQITAFLDAHGLGSAARDPLPVDCSYRTYTRLVGGAKPLLFMNSPPDLEPLAPFVQVGNHLEMLGFSTPHIEAAEVEDGFALVEDFGHATFTRLLDQGEDARRLYGLAIDTLVSLQTDERAPHVAVPAYDTAKLLSEAALFLDWYWPAVQPAAVPATARAEYNAILSDLLAPLQNAAPLLVLRDFHVDNLMILDGRQGISACGLLDFQDAVLGHPAYDLVSLLQDARRDLAPDLVNAMLARYAAAAPHLIDRQAYYTLGAQRHLKVFGIFARQSRRDGKHRYLGHIARLWRLLEECIAAEPALAPLGEWLARYWPESMRIVPETTEAATA